MSKRPSLGQQKELVYKSVIVTLVAAILLATSWGQELDVRNCLPKGAICERVKCAPALPCDSGVIVENGSRCRCCPVCVTLIGNGEECPNTTYPEEGPVHSKQCMPGFQCLEGYCQKNDSYLTDCQIERENRMNGIEEFPAVLPPNNEIWLPECDDDGNYKPKQCQHGRCFCVDRETGERTFGQEERDLADNMTCACSHALHERYKQLKKSGREAEWHTYEQEHCTTTGDYEDLQCFKDTCFCVHPQNGIPYGTMVKMKQRDQLPCYDPKLYKESYLTRCEKQLFTERRILYDFAQKNITIRGLIEIRCDPDGSFVRNLCKPEICYCSDRAGSSFGVYKKDRLDGQMDSVMQCQCARDEEDIRDNNARYERLKCDQYGNYAVFQCFDEDCFCVDKNGDRITEIKNLKETGIQSIRDECLRLLELLGERNWMSNSTSTLYYSDTDNDAQFMTYEN